MVPDVIHYICYRSHLCSYTSRCLIDDPKVDTCLYYAGWLHYNHVAIHVFLWLLSWLKKANNKLIKLGNLSITRSRLTKYGKSLFWDFTSHNSLPNLIKKDTTRTLFEQSSCDDAIFSWQWSWLPLTGKGYPY